MGHKIRTTINPGEVLTVDDAELLDLTRQGLVLDEKATEKIEKAEAAAAAKADEQTGDAGKKGE
jgi:hypothetical protein